MKNRTILVVLSIAAAAAAGCTGFERESSPTSPTAAGNNSLLGSWTSSQLIPTPSTCTDFVWNVSEQTATSAKGSFTATFPGDLKLTGTAQNRDIILLTPDEFKYSNSVTALGATAEVLWKRVA